MPKRFLGNIMTDAPTAPDGPYKDSAASGVWSLAEVLSYTKGGLWPNFGNTNPVGLFVGHGGNTGAGITNKINIDSAANAVDFGDLSGANADHNATSSSSTTQYMGGASNSVRWIIAGGNNNLGGISYGNFTTSGSAQSFGDLGTGRRLLAGLANATRGIFAGGSKYGAGYSNVIEYVTIASTGNAATFGTISANALSASGCASSTRGIIAGGGRQGGNFGSSGASDRIDYITIGSTGNTTDFGNLSATSSSATATSNQTLGLINNDSDTATDKITIASTGNATNFASLNTSGYFSGATASQTRAIFVGGSAGDNRIEFFTFASAGTAVDFGDLTENMEYKPTGHSTVHGGLTQ